MHLGFDGYTAILFTIAMLTVVSVGYLYRDKKNKC